MPNPYEYTPPGPVPPEAYGPEYFFSGDRLIRYFAYKPERDIPLAEAIGHAVGLLPGDPVLDFGCGPGAITAAFNAAGYPTIGVDTSPSAIESAIPEAQGRVRLLDNKLQLSDLPNDMVRLVVASHVFEHLAEGTEERLNVTEDIHEIVDELICIGRQVLAIIPATDENGSFIFEPFNRDKTHVTRLTTSLWQGRFGYSSVRRLEEIEDLAYRGNNIPGTLFLLLEETDAKMRAVRMRARAEARTPMRRRILGLSPSPFDVDFDSLLDASTGRRSRPARHPRQWPRSRLR